MPGVGAGVVPLDDSLGNGVPTVAPEPFELLMLLSELPSPPQLANNKPLNKTMLKDSGLHTGFD
jgi:hypothetical protein